MNYFKKIFFCAAVAAAFISPVRALVVGGQFKDRILPMQGSVTLETLKAENPNAKIWGAPDVQNRFVDNGVEVDGMNIWGGNVYKDADGKYHQFVAGWDGITRAFSYWSNSHIYHFTSDTPYGPFTNPVDIGRGHNPEIFIAKDGTYVVYALIGNSSCWRHTSASLNGPWVFEEMPYDLRDRALSTGSTTTYSNWTFARREDGSVYCMDRGGAVWVSEDGLKPFGQMLGTTCYPNGGGRTFEDPVVWKDEVQYHMIVNDWNARKAYYSRSADGFHWVAEDGLAYDIEVSVHPDGTREQWYKYERPRVFQDKYGRAIQLNMAVIDTIKAQDVANDNHSSKNIAMPLNPGLRLFVLNDSPISTSTSAIQVKVMAEDGFTPATDLDIESLRFGGYATVNNGGGAAVQSSETDSDGNLILTFNGANTGIKSDEFAPKLLGKYRNGYTMTNEAGKAMAPAFCYGYAKLPYYKYTPAYLSPVLPTVGEGSNLTTVRIDNCGLSASTEGQVVKVLTTSGTVLATGTVTSLAAYESAVVELTSVRSIPSGQTSLVVAFYDGSTKTDSHTLLLTDINALQAKLSAKYNEALQLYNNEAYANGRIAMNAALTEAKSHLQSYYEPEITSAMEALQGAMAQFVSDNPDVPNITCRNYYLKPATINSGNTYMYVSADGTLARKNSYDASSIFTLIVDGDNNRTYLYNPSSKTFVVAKVGSGTSFWTASAANAYCLGGIAASNTTTDAYTIKGDATSTNAFNYLNAYGGANHTELCSYTQDNSGSQWTLVEADDQTYTFDVTNVTTGLDAFLATAKRISKAVITPSVTAVSQIKTTPCAKSKPQYYTLTGQSVAQSYKGVVVCQGKKYIQ